MVTTIHNDIKLSLWLSSCLQCFDTVGWVAGQISGL